MSNEVDPDLFDQDENPFTNVGRTLRPAKLTTGMAQGLGSRVKQVPGAAQGLGAKALSVGKSFIPSKAKSVAAMARNIDLPGAAATGTRVSRRAQIAAKAMRGLRKAPGAVRKAPGAISSLVKSAGRSAPGVLKAGLRAAPGALKSAAVLQAIYEAGVAPLRGITAMRADPNQKLGTSTFEAAGMDESKLAGFAEGMIGGTSERAGEEGLRSVSDGGYGRLYGGDESQSFGKRAMNSLGTAAQGTAMLGRAGVGLGQYLFTGDKSHLVNPIDPDNYRQSSEGAVADPYGFKQEGFSQEEVARAVEAGQRAKAQRLGLEAGEVEEAAEIEGLRAPELRAASPNEPITNLEDMLEATRNVHPSELEDPETGVFLDGQKVQGLGDTRREGDPNAAGTVTIGGRTFRNTKDAFKALEGRPGGKARNAARRRAQGLPASGIEVDDNVEELGLRNRDLRRKEDKRVLGLEKKRIAAGKESTVAFLKRHNLKPSQTSAIARARARDASKADRATGRTQARSLAREKTNRETAKSAAAEKAAIRKSDRARTDTTNQKFTAKQQVHRDELKRLSSLLKGLGSDGDPKDVAKYKKLIAAEKALLNKSMNS